ncbi:hypothetical protein D3C87_1290020 [compost metagenome]
MFLGSDVVAAVAAVGAERVELRPPLRIREHCVGFIDLLHLGRRPLQRLRIAALVLVGVVLGPATLVGQCDLGFSGAAANSEDLVVVFHGSSRQSRRHIAVA